MVMWLDQKEEAPSDLEVWGVQKTHYFFSDLQIFLDNRGSLMVEPSTPVKGKGKAKVVEGGKKDGKRKAKDEGTQKKKQKKSDGLVKKKV